MRIQQGAQPQEVVDRLRRALQGAPLEPSPEGSPLTPAAVLVSLYEAEQLYWLFIRRTTQVEHHKGEVSFPGGVWEPCDRTPLDTALREAQEELGIEPGAVTVLGSLAPVVTRTGFRIQPYVGLLLPSLHLRPNAREVEEVLHVPHHALEAGGRMVEVVRIDGMKESRYAYTYGGQVIWGATARIVSQVLRLLEQAALAKE